MELVIDFGKIKDPSKREWLISSLKLMHIAFQTTEKPQTLAQYNKDLEKGMLRLSRANLLQRRI